MANHFFSKGKYALSAISALLGVLLLVTGCNTGTEHVDRADSDSGKEAVLPINELPAVVDPIPSVIDVPVATAVPDWDSIQLMVRTDPADPHNERFLDDWRFELYTIDDQARPTSPIYYGETGPDGTALVGLPSYMFALPLIVTAYNTAFPLGNPDLENDDYGECRILEIFVPPYCYNQAIWLLGPFEDALWRYYKQAARRRAEAWNPSQVDCGTWLANIQLLIQTDEVSDELNELSDRPDMVFREEVLVDALQENQAFLTPTRPPICMAERRHNGGGMERGDLIQQEDEDLSIDNAVGPFGPFGPAPDLDEVIVDLGNGLVSDICDAPHWEDEALVVNGTTFIPINNYKLDDDDFMGTVSDQAEIVPKIDATTYNVRLGNGRELDHDKYDDACAITTMVQFTNTDDDEQDLNIGTGVTLSNLFEDGTNTDVYLTSDGDAVVDDNDYWAIFYESGANSPAQRSVIAVELLGHRQEDFRDVLHMTFDKDTEDLFLGLRADFELNEEEVDGERAFMAYTIHVWDGSSISGRAAVRQNILDCYEAADVWARQFFVTEDFQVKEEECCVDDECHIESVIEPTLAAEFAVRSQCFSNSRANQRWRTDDSGYWAINTVHGVHGNVVINPGWLAPDLDFEIYIQKFDEAVFKGPRTIRRTDDCGQMMVALPTLVEGDRVLIKSEDNCCDDYDLVLPCVPEFTGFAGAPGVPYVPDTLGPPPVPPAPVPIP